MIIDNWKYNLDDGYRNGKYSFDLSYNHKSEKYQWILSIDESIIIGDIEFFGKKKIYQLNNIEDRMEKYLTNHINEYITIFEREIRNRKLKEILKL